MKINMWMRTFIFMFALIFMGSVLPVIAVPEDAEEKASPGAVFPQTTYSEFVAAHQFPYRADPDRIAGIRQNFDSLSPGLDMARVLSCVGGPDFVQHLYSKGPSPGLIGASWVYVFEKQDPKLTNVFHDLTIEVFFDKTGRVFKIFSNIDGLTPINSTDPVPRHP
jgi:hypothetical protein